tara:strand:+ start:81 stop:1067 length:987 start_codon:yes stop_codon:yes gene_type:complete
MKKGPFKMKGPGQKSPAKAIGDGKYVEGFKKMTTKQLFNVVKRNDRGLESGRKEIVKRTQEKGDANSIYQAMTANDSTNTAKRVIRQRIKEGTFDDGSLKKGENPFKMKGFSGFGDGTNRSPVKAADEGLIEAAKMGSDEVAKTTRQMGNNLANMVSRIGGNNDKDNDKDKDNSPVTFKMNGKDNLKGHSTKKRGKLLRANKALSEMKMPKITQKDLKPFSKGLDMTLNDNLNKAVRKSEAKEFLRKNTIKPKAKKPLSRPFGPGTRPLARNVSRGLRALGRFTGIIGGVIAAAPHIIKGSKAVMPGLKKRAKQEFKGKRSIYSSPKI